MKPWYWMALTLLASTVPAAAQTVVSNQSPATEAQPAIDSAKLLVSRRIAARLIPDGIMKKVMGSTMDLIMGGMMDKVMDMPVRDLAGLTGLKEEQLPEVGTGTMREIMAILDPAFKERSTLGMTAMMGEMIAVMGKMEPDLREAMAEAYVNQFTTEELGDLDRFFATPSGMSYAAKTMTLQTDPAFIKRMQSMVPMIMEAMPAMVAKAGAATKALPPPRKASQLSPEEKAKLAGLLGVKVSDLK